MTFEALPIQKSVGRRASLALLGIALAFIGWKIIRDSISDALTEARPQTALRWNPVNAAALIALAQRHAPSPFQVNAPRSQNAPPAAPLDGSTLHLDRQLSQRALDADPLASQALSGLALIANAEGDQKQVQALMQMAADRALRDQTAQGWLMESAFRRGDYATAVNRLDILLRTHPEILDRSAPLFAALISYPQSASLLAHALASSPPWRTWLLTAAPNAVRDLSALERFYALLQTGPRPPTGHELDSYVDRLVKERLFKQAYSIWIRSLPPARRPQSLDALYNGKFQFAPSGSPFDWRILSNLGADIAIGPSNTVGERALHIEFSGARVDFQNVSHLLLLGPGTYDLSGQVEADSLSTERGLWWRVFCAEQPDGVLAHTELLTQDTPWRPFNLRFEVPTSGCEAQMVRLELPARVALERQISGEVSYKDLSLERVQ